MLRDASCIAGSVLHKDGRRWVVVLVNASEAEILQACGAMWSIMPCCGCRRWRCARRLGVCGSGSRCVKILYTGVQAVVGQ